MMTHLDMSVGAIVKSLEEANMLKDSIVVFSTDNGGVYSIVQQYFSSWVHPDKYLHFDSNIMITIGPAEGFNLNAASNWPLRGVKNTLWEGGVRGTGYRYSIFGNSF